jgi:hypothetical protein
VLRKARTVDDALDMLNRGAGLVDRLRRGRLVTGAAKREGIRTYQEKLLDSLLDRFGSFERS